MQVVDHNARRSAISSRSSPLHDPQQHLQPVQQRLERQITAQRVATPGQDDGAPARAVEQRRQQRALPDARLTDDDHRALGRVGVQHPVQPAELVIQTGGDQACGVTLDFTRGGGPQ